MKRLEKRKLIQQTTVKIRKSKLDDFHRPTKFIRIDQKEPMIIEMYTENTVFDKIGKEPCDCVVCVLEKMRLLTKGQAQQYRQEFGNKGMGMNDFLEILHSRYPSFEMSMIFVTDLTLKKLALQMRPNHSTFVVLFVKPGYQVSQAVDKHMVILFKDAKDRIGFYDPQAGESCLMDCVSFLHYYDQESFYVVSFSLRSPKELDPPSSDQEQDTSVEKLL